MRAGEQTEMKWLLTRITALLLAVSLSGCSFVFNRSSSSAYDPRRGDPDCDTCAGPIVDGKE